MVKVNEIQQHATGFTLKTNKDDLANWTHKINEWFLSIDYDVSEKYDGHGHQLSYTSGEQKIVFVYYPTGRIVVKTKDIDKFKCIFIEKHEQILGIKLHEIPGKKSPDDTLTMSPNRGVRTPTYSTPKGITTSPTESKQKIRTKGIIFENLEKEFLTLRDDFNVMQKKITDLEKENLNLHEVEIPTLKGKVNEMETIIETLKRELREKLWDGKMRRVV